MSAEHSQSAKHTALYPIYQEHQGRLIEFADYQMPAQYQLGVKAEHLWCRQHAGFFDISHMGQAWLLAESGRQTDAVEALEQLVGADLQALSPGKQQYTQLLNEQGGILDDLIVTKPAEAQLQDRLYTVVNAACKEQDFAYINEKLQGHVRVERLEQSSLIALQGPSAIAVAQRHFPGVEQLTFMTWQIFPFLPSPGVELYISRSGYTGEDGIEISVPNQQAIALARLLLAEEEVQPIGLGARDSLRLEAGLCLYGSDMNSETSPVEADLLWSIGKRRRAEGGFAGAETILRQLAEKPSRKRVGLDIQSKVPCRTGVPIYASQDGGQDKIGKICSGGFSPCLEKPIAMAYVSSNYSKVGTPVWLEVRGKRIPAQVCKMPFVAQKYVK